MPTIDYSPEAQNILSFFYRRDIVLYVEGEDDVPFWQAIFEELSGATVEVLPVFGATEVEKKITEITSSNLTFLAARDSDYLRFQGAHVNDPRILYTLGYSIENCLYSPATLKEMSFIWCRGRAKKQVSEDGWLDDLLEKLRDLVAYDLANNLFQKGLCVIPDNCTKFMRGQNSAELDPAKLERYLEELSTKISSAELDHARNLINNSGIHIRRVIRGHFLASLAQKHIAENLKQSGRGQNISFEAVYASAMSSFKRLITSSDEKTFYQTSVTNALAALGIFQA
ncbi:DUF4435 domain-containing protein [Pseudomonas tohonis]|uniref:DUF4435 domain-containing protein n=1 Tax=Pseudomonas tohonis TaxID=2725477 RepID=UPI0021D8D6D9|nr:DUF4435 domain-containing protein [Pseudomonas tohonis]UXY53568.1 DUF4435 domain-containing protein [Pseudomonas tohonis]